MALAFGPVPRAVGRGRGGFSGVLRSDDGGDSFRTEKAANNSLLLIDAAAVSASHAAVVGPLGAQYVPCRPSPRSVCRAARPRYPRHGFCTFKWRLGTALLQRDIQAPSIRAAFRPAAQAAPFVPPHGDVMTPAMPCRLASDAQVLDRR